MSLDRSFKDHGDLQGLSGDAIIDLIIIDILPLAPNRELDPAIRYIHMVNWGQTQGQTVTYGGTAYYPFPFRLEGAKYKTEGVPPNPTVIFGNIGLEFSEMVSAWEDLIGAWVIRRRVMARFLDNGSTPNSQAHWPDETWSIQQKDSENKLTVTFVLSTAFDLDGVKFPGRRALRYSCTAIYRSKECSYTGPPVATIDNVATVANVFDKCSHTITGCKKRFPTGDLPFNGFPGLMIV